MGAGAPQFFCQVLFFRLNGTFIFLTSGLSLLFSFGMLLPLLMIVGPEGHQGELRPLLCYFCKGRRAATQQPTRKDVSAAVQHL